MIKHRFELLSLLVMLLSFGLGTTEFCSPMVGILGRLIACGPPFETIQINDVTHQLACAFCGKKAEARGSGDVFTNRYGPIAPPASQSPLPRTLHHVRRAMQVVLRGGTTMMYHDEVLTRQQMMHQSLGQYGIFCAFPKTDSSRQGFRVQR
jgi:hypothetical protein